MPGFLAKTLLFGGILLVIVAIGIFEAQKGPELDESVRMALRELGMDRIYGMRVETLVGLGDRGLAIEGLYRIDAPQDAYASEATTTLIIRESGEKHSFSLGNMSLGDTVYVSVASESPLLTRTLPLTGGWRSFESKAIPEQFRGIAVHGPILDNALLFEEEGAHLAFLEKSEDENGQRYAFRLSDPEAVAGGTLATLFERIGENGRVYVWLNDGRIVRALFTGSDYTSTTTFTSDIVPITLPR